MLKQLISEGKVQESTKSLASRLQKGGKSSASSKAAALSSIVPVSDNSLLRYKTMHTKASSHLGLGQRNRCWNVLMRARKDNGKGKCVF